MKIIGKHDGGLDNQKDCKITIQDSTIGVYTYNNTKKEELNQPKDDTK